MGSLGDKFKKLAGDQTRQLLQNFQNAQSSKTRNGYSYGKLNEDGTATLADGTVVQTVVKGRPGQYAPVFNLGNGQGLVDQPEAKFFNIDSSGVLRYYGLIVNMVQQYNYSDYAPQNNDPVDYVSFYFNILKCESVELKDLLSGASYFLDPTLYASFTDFPIPYYYAASVPPLGYFNIDFLGGPLRTSTHFQRYKYSGVEVAFSFDGRDILLYQISNTRETDNRITYLPNSPPLLLQTLNIDVGALTFYYKILKDYYIEDGIVKSDTTISGSYTVDEPAVTSSTTYTEFDIQSPVSTGLRNSQELAINALLCRDAGGNPQLNLLVQTTVYTTEMSFTLHEIGSVWYADQQVTEGEGFHTYMVRDVSTNPTVTWTSTYQEPGKVQAVTEMFDTKFYGTSTEGFALNTRSKVNVNTFAPEEVIGADISSSILLGDQNHYGPSAIYLAEVEAGIDLGPLGPLAILHRPYLIYTDLTFFISPGSYIVGNHIKENTWLSAEQIFNVSTNTSHFLLFRLDSNGGLVCSKSPKFFEVMPYYEFTDRPVSITIDQGQNEGTYTLTRSNPYSTVGFIR